MKMRFLKSKLGRIFRKLIVFKYRMMGVRIGRNCFISTGAWIDDHKGKVLIGDNVTITKGVKVLSHDATFARLNYGARNNPTTILDNNVFIGMNAIVLSGVHVHENCIIGAGCVVSKDVPRNCVAVGNPMKIIKKYNDKTAKWETVSS